MSWLEEHFRTRHAFGAHPFRCLLTNCTARFATSRQLDEHVRRGHFEYTVKCGVSPTAAVNGKDEEAHGLRWEPEPMPSLWGESFCILLLRTSSNLKPARPLDTKHWEIVRKKKTYHPIPYLTLYYFVYVLCLTVSK